MSGPGRPPPFLAARQHSSVDGIDASASPLEARPSSRPKRTLIESACSACRRRKSRCDGIRPSCSRCQSLHTDCTYEAEEGESRWSALRRRNQILETERSELRELLSFLQSRPEAEALEIFDRIRRGQEDVFDILRDFRDGGGGGGGSMRHPGVPSLPRQMSSLSSGSSGSGTEHRLPPISSMFNVPGPLPQTTRPMLPPTTSSGSSSQSLHSGSAGSASHFFYDPPSTAGSP